MALRFLLVSLVAGMGFEMPSGSDVASWSRTGRDWAVATYADLAGPCGRVAGCERPAGLAATPASLAMADLAFQAANEGMAADFSIDLALSRADDAARAVEAVALVDAVSTGLPAGEEMWAVSEPAPVAATAPARVARLSTAVRLTREAAHAWAILMQPSEAFAAR